MKKAFRLGLVTVIALSAVLALSIGASAVKINESGTAIDYEEETLTVAAGDDREVTDYEYSLDGKAWKDLWGEELDISSLISTSKDVKIWFADKKETDSQQDSIPVTIPKRAATTVSAKYDGKTEEITVTGDGDYEFMSGLTTWADYDTSISTEHLTSAATVSVRAKAVVTEGNTKSFKTVPATVSIPARAAAPSAPVYDVATDSIKGLTAGRMQIAYSSEKDAEPDTDAYVDVKAAAISRADIEKKLDYEDLNANTSDIGYYFIRVTATAGAPASHAAMVTIPASSATELTVGDFSIDYEKETLTPDDSTTVYEYSKDNKKTYAALPATGLNLKSIIPAATYAENEITLYVRTKAIADNKATTGVDETAPASEPVDIPILKRPKTPAKTDVYYDTEAEAIKITEGAYADIADIISYYDSEGGKWSADPIATGEEGVAMPATSKSVSVKLKVAASDEEGTERFASAEFTLTIPARPATPKPVYNAATDSITGVSANMEWAESDNASEWAPFSGTTAPRAFFGEPEAIYIRTKHTPTLPASLPAGPLTFPDAVTKPSAITIDFATEKLTLPGGTELKAYEYTKYTNFIDELLPSNAKWTALPASITSLIPAPTAASGVKLAIRLKATGDNPASEPIDLEIAKRSAPPTKADVQFNGVESKIELVSELANLKYMGPEGDSYEAASEDINITPSDKAQSYKFRVEKDETPFSTVFTVTVPAKPAKPSAPTYSAATDSLTGLTIDKMELASTAEPETWTKATAKAMTRTELTDKELLTESKKVYVRTMATATAPASEAKEVEFPGTVTAPGSVAIDYENEKITISGATAALEYSKNGGTSWTSITSGASITSLIPASTAGDLAIEVRYKATSTTPASSTVSATIKKRPETPSKTTVTYNYNGDDANKFTGTALSTGLQYDDGTGYKDLSAETSITPDPAKSQSIKIRVKANDAPASLVYTVTIAKPAAAPSAVKWDAKKAQVTGTTTAMEYKIGVGEDWIKLTTGDVLNYTALGNEKTTIYVRTAATASAPASAAKPVDVPENPNKPAPPSEPEPEPEPDIEIEENEEPSNGT
jgi:hypothetical protein